MTLPTGKLLLNVALEMNLSKDLAFKPFSIAPDLWYGLNDDLTLGIVHSAVGRTSLYAGAGDGLCLTGTSNGCAKVYDNLGLAARYNFLRGAALALAVDGGFYISTFDPFALALEVGLVGRWTKSKFALEFAPRFFLGLSNRDTSTKETLAIPVSAFYSVHPRVAIGLQLGLGLPLENLGDLWTFVLGFGARFRATDKLTFDLAFAFPALAGGNLISTGGDARTLTLGVGYAF